MNGTTASINFLTTDDDASAMEAFIGTNHSTLFPPPTPLRPPLPQFNEDTLQQRLQALIEAAGESWTYAIFWQISHDFDSSTGDNTVILGWGDGFYRGEEDKEKKKNNNSNWAEQEHRKRVIRELNSLISGGIGVSDESNDEEVTDTEWFFLVSMTQSFVSGVGLPGESFLNSRVIWLSGSGALTGSGCERAGQGQIYGLETMVCIAAENGVVELGSSELINQSSDLMDKVNHLFNGNNGGEACSWGLNLNPDQGENDLALWISEQTNTGIESPARINGLLDLSLMGYKTVYRSLTELFPQIDARILKAVAIEHPKDANEAAAVVVSEIVPKFYPNLADTSTQAGNKTPGNVPNKVERDMQNGALTGSETGASSSGTIPLAVDCDHETRAPITELPANRNQLTNVMPNGDLDIQSKVKIGLSGSAESGVVSSDPPAFVRVGAKVTSDGWQGVEFHITGSQAEASTSAVSEDAVHKLVYPADNSAITQKSSRFQFGFGNSDDVKDVSSGSLAGENSDAELSGSNHADVTSLAVENGDPELGGSFSSIVSRTTQRCNIDHLEQIIEDAKNNKRTLFTVMESIMNLMREVELQEKDAEKVKEDAARGGVDTLEKVDELKKMLEHAKEANNMDAGEVYGERSILTTEVIELENRLLNLSEERDKSLSVLDEMRGSLETRLAAALEIKNAAEQEKQGKEGSARKAFAEQEAIMEKVVQESKLLQQEAEENSKLREFLMDHGRIVDSLQGEISVICQDIRHLKEKFDNRVPLSQSISSSQTSCKLASSVSSMKSLLLEKPFEASYDTPETSSNKNKSPKALVNEGKDEGKELLEDGWDMFDKETEL